MPLPVFDGGAWVALVSAALSTTVAIVTLWFSHRERRAPMRAAMYQKQVEVQTQVIAELSELRRALFDYIHGLQFEDEALREGAKDRMVAYNDVLHSSFSTMGLIAPKEVILEYVTLLNVARDFLDEVLRDAPIKRLEEVLDLFDFGHTQVIVTARAHLGVDPLGMEATAILTGSRGTAGPKGSLDRMLGPFSRQGGAPEDLRRLSL